MRLVEKETQQTRKLSSKKQLLTSTGMPAKVFLKVTKRRKRHLLQTVTSSTKKPTNYLQWVSGLKNLWNLAI